MTIRERRIGEITILHILGKLGPGQAEEDLSRKIDGLVEERRVRVIVDMKDMQEMDSSALRALIQAYTVLRRSEGSLKLLHPSGKAMNLLSLSGMIHFIDAFADESEAIASFAVTRS